MRKARYAVALAAAAISASCIVSIADEAGDPKPSHDASAGSAGQSSGGVGGGTSGGSAGQSAGGVGGSAGGAGADAGSSGSSGSGGSVSEPGLIGHWPFDEGSGTQAKDLTPNARHGDLATSGIAWTDDAKYGKALLFSAPQAGVVMPGWWNTAFPTAGTLLFWLKATLIGNDTSARNFFDGHDPGRNHIFVRHANGSPNIDVQCAFQPANSSYAFVKTLLINNDVWQLVGVAWNVTDKTGYCYVHGLRSPGTIQGDWTPNEQAFRIGANFQGVIDDVRLYDHMLTDEELDKLLVASP